MRVSINKLRWGLAGGAVGLVLLLLALVGYGRYRALVKGKELADKFGIHVERETDGYTISQSLKGQTVFTLHAAKAIQHTDGKVTLRNVIVTMYGRKGDRYDRIYGAEFEYDDKSGVARAVGEVHMDIRAPGGLTKNGSAPVPVKADPHSSAALSPEGQEADPRDVHVRTSGLVFVRKLGVAATQEPVEFRYGGMQCTAKGAEFNSEESAVHLLADVRLNGDLRGKPVALRASRADLNREDNTVALANPQMVSDGKTAHAANVLLHLRSDGSVETANAGGGVVFEQGTRKLTAARLAASMSGANLLQHARLLGGVVMDDTDPARVTHGTAAELDGTFNAAGAPANWVATGNPRVRMASRNERGEVFQRDLHGDRLEAQFRAGAKKGSSEVSEVHVLGQGSAMAESPVAGGKAGERKTVQVAADSLRALFAPGKGSTPEVQKVFGEGHTLLQQDAPRGEQQISRGEHLELTLGVAEKQGGSPQLLSVVQSGHVEVQSRAAAKSISAASPETVYAKADRSSYDAASGKLLLAGNAQFTQGGLSMSSASATVDARSGDSDAEGGVVANVVSAGSKTSEATHVRADMAHLQRSTELVEFRGSDAHPVRMWQGASQVEAATLLLDGKRKTMAARRGGAKGAVHAVFAAKGGGAAGKEKTASADTGKGVTDVSAAKMDYDDVARTATFDGGVRMTGATGQVQAQHAVAFLTPAATKSGTAPAAEMSISPLGGSLQRAVIWGDVHLNQPGRIARGDRLVYNSADASFVLTGTPGKLPQVVDAERGTITGTALLFRTGDNTVIVSGAAVPAQSAPGQGGRVRLELGAKQ